MNMGPSLTKIMSYYVRGTAFGVSNLISRTARRSLKPRWLWFEVTDRCNSRCLHCNIWRKKPTKDALTPKEIEKALNDPLFRDVEYVLNSGGEAVLRDDLEEIILTEHRALPKAVLQLSTNGLLPERVIKVVKSAIKHGANISVGVSLDGIGEKHDLIRGVKGNFHNVERLLQELVILRKKYEDKISPTIGFTLSDSTLSSLEEVRAYAQKLNVYCLAQWYNTSSFYDNTNRKLASSKNLIKAVQSFPLTPLNEMWLNSLVGKPIKFRCFAMDTFCALKCNGDIVPCLSLWDATAGNIRESSPTDIWNSSDAKKVKKLVKSCQGCLNNWGVGWSFESSFIPILLFNIKHLRTVLGKPRER